MKIINSDYIEQFLERTFKPHFIVLLLSIILEVSFPVQLIIQIMEGDINVSIEIKRIYKSPRNPLESPKLEQKRYRKKTANPQSAHVGFKTTTFTLDSKTSVIEKAA